MRSDIALYSDYMYSYPHKTAYRSFVPPLPLAPFFDTLANTTGSLYFHLPFCSMKCGFCNLFSSTRHTPTLLATYLAALRRQATVLSQLAAQVRFSSFAIGGGTPLVLNEAQMDELLDAAACFGVSPERVETSVETSPDHARPEALRHLRQRGVTRLSIGIQSFREDELRRLKRATCARTCHAALDNIVQAGFPKLNIDLIYGIENQTPDDFLASLEAALRYQPSELFLYPLYVRPGTPLKTRAEDAACHTLYRAALDVLRPLGYRQTSMRRFVQSVRDDPGAEGASCGDEVMLSCGCGGRSYVGDLHYASPYATDPRKIRAIVDEYCAARDFSHARHGYVLNQDERQRRFIIKNLMFWRGIDGAEFQRRFQADIAQYDFSGLLAEGFIVRQEERLVLTEKGLAASDHIGQLFISPAVRAKMRAYSETP
ncbi:MAG: STM4012 family radical SAM protein [Zoogloeaceae bacterium]|jgi:oxygen-independent coproporphyrinogen-3 oxidase|nr:STM4012 family radical SAM protein [Zoogloeaceae bacterium]